MGVEKDGRFARSAQPFAVGVRVGIAAAEDLDILQAGLAHLRTGERGTLLDFLLVFAVGADAGNRHQVGQVADQRGMILLEPIQSSHDTPPRKMSDEESVYARRVGGKRSVIRS